VEVFRFFAATCAVGAIAMAGGPGPAQAEQPQLLMAVTVDDLPVAQPSWHTNEQMARITTDLLAVFAEHGVPAVGFVNESKLDVDGVVDDFRVGILQRWLDAGFELGNHGYAHLDLHRVPPEEWMADVVRGERETRRLVEASGGNLRYFRHPFLHAGMSPEIQMATSEFLQSRGYTVAPVTIDNSEWIYGRAYAHAYNAGDEDLKERIGRDYIRYMLEVVAYYEAQSEAIVGRRIPHILLVHAYALNADWLDDLFVELEERGFGWITLEETLEDPVYKKPIDGWTGMGGITWLHRWAITDGVDRSVFQGEPEPPEWVAEIRP
jgi:peptidoglycan/xylan/chitin deacetylase (PgdA/CDA1 family)